MTANRSDMYILSQDTAFQNRVRAALIAAAVAIKNEAVITAFHRERETYVVAIMNAPATYTPLFANAAATDANVISDATQGGTVVLTSGNVATQGALCTDAHIDAAISSQFNSFFRTPAS